MHSSQQNLQNLKNQMALQHHPQAIHPSSNYPTIHHQTGHFLPSPALASPVGSNGGTTIPQQHQQQQQQHPQQQPPNPPLAANAPCSTLFVANLGQFVSEHELKEMFAR